GWSAFALSLPAGTRAPRSPVLLLVSRGHLLSLTLHAVELQARPAYEDVPWGTRCALHVIAAVLDRNETLAAQVEHELRELESVGAETSPETFFEAILPLTRNLAL